MKWKTVCVRGPIAMLILAYWSQLAVAQHYEILEEQLDEELHGYTVIRLFGSHYEMGFGIGEYFADEIVAAWLEAKEAYEDLYPMARLLTSAMTFMPVEIEDEINGMLDGILSVDPDASLDALDLKIMNIIVSDLAYYTGCRAHSAWGRYVEEPVLTLSTRRVDYGTPFDIALHHVLYAWDPDDGSVRWANLGWPGMITVITGVNAFGTQVSTHDIGTLIMNGGFKNNSDGMMPRVVATRYLLTGMNDLPLSQHLDWAEEVLSDVDIMTDQFLNFFAPEGYGGVFTCEDGSCERLRVPQVEYFNGEVLMTTNRESDGQSTPSGGGFMENYYDEGYPKDLASHFELMGTDGLHIMSVEYRGEEDMTLWIHGRGQDDRLEVEWSGLFSTDQVGDAGGELVEVSLDASHDNDNELVDGPTTDTTLDDDSGCDCVASGRFVPPSWLWAFALLGLLARWRHRSECAAAPTYDVGAFTFGVRCDRLTYDVGQIATTAHAIDDLTGPPNPSLQSTETSPTARASTDR